MFQLSSEKDPMLECKMTVKKTNVWSPYGLYYPSEFREDSNGRLVQVESIPIVEREFTTPKAMARVNLCVFENGVWAVITVAGSVQSDVRLWPYRREALEDFGKMYKMYFKRDIATAKKEKGYSLVAKKKIKDDFDIGIVVIHEIDIVFLKKVALASWNYMRESLRGTGYTWPAFQEYEGQFLAKLQEDW